MVTFSGLGVFGKSRLGNQMFQYAATKSAALNTNSLFAIPAENQEISRCFDLDCKYYSLQNTRANLDKLSKYFECTFQYENRFNDISARTDLEGYFQSEKYFIKHEDVIRQDFTFKTDTYEASKKFIDSFGVTEQKLVSLHIRRGDYLQLQNFHPVCSLEYYNKAIDTFKDCTFIVFSDDMGWCKQNLKNNNVVYSELQNHAQDLCAMSLCYHNIIANSSFSWWGAWLNKNPNKQVVAPRNWFGKDYSDKSTIDLYCKDWTVI